MTPAGGPDDPVIETTKRWLQQEAAQTVQGMEAYWGEPVEIRSVPEARGRA